LKPPLPSKNDDYTLYPEVPDAVLKPLAEEDEFKAESSLKSLWKALQRKTLPLDECYFVRMDGPGAAPRCTGLVLLQRSAVPTKRSPLHQFDIKGLCSSLPSGQGMGILLMAKLVSFLKTHDSATHINVRLHKCTVAAAGFYRKLGFESMTPQGARAGDALFLDVGKSEWEVKLIERMGGIDDLLNKVLRDTAALPVSVEDGLLKSLWALEPVPAR
jgi:hypothetical protein